MNNENTTVQEARCNDPNHPNLASRVVVSDPQRERLASGGITCPVCSTPCKPVLARIPPSQWPDWVVQLRAWCEESEQWVDAVSYVQQLPGPGPLEPSAG